MELAGQGITSAAICPGEINTEFTKNRIQHFDGNVKYDGKVQALADEFIKKQEKRMPADYAADRIFKIINKKKIKPFYIIGNKYRLMYFFSRLVPTGLLLKAINKKYGGKNKT
jgi:short-subunit dehydrogenase